MTRNDHFGPLPLAWVGTFATLRKVDKSREGEESSKVDKSRESGESGVPGGQPGSGPGSGPGTHFGTTF